MQVDDHSMFTNGEICTKEIIASGSKGPAYVPIQGKVIKANKEGQAQKKAEETKRWMTKGKDFQEYQEDNWTNNKRMGRAH